MSVNRIAFLIDRTTRLALIAGFSLGLANFAHAFEVTAEQREACTPDAFRLCSSEIPDIGRVTACMSANKSRLSPGCRAVFETARLERAAPASRQERAYRGLSASHNRSRHGQRHRIWARS
jgi:hypothetical protein